MIRPFEPQDLEAIVALVREDTLMPADEIGDLVTGRRSWVYCRDGAVCGVVCTTVFDDAHGLRLYVGPRWRGAGIGGELYDYVRPQFDAPGPDRVNTSYRANIDLGARTFFAKRGFTHWYGVVGHTPCRAYAHAACRHLP